MFQRRTGNGRLLHKDDTVTAVKMLAAVSAMKALGPDDADGTIEGYASVFGNVDAYGERVMPGAFIDSLVAHKQRGTRIKMFWGHDSSQVIGRWVDMAEDKKGLYAKGQLNLKVMRGAETYELLKSGDVDGLSIGYRELQSENNNGVRELQQVDLLEVSVVSLPANTRATVDDIKAVHAAARFEALCRSLREGKPLPVKDFEDVLREAGVPKSMATQIASVGYAKAIRSESESEAEAAARELRDAIASFR